MGELDHGVFEAFKAGLVLPSRFGECWGWRGASASWSPGPEHPEQSIPRWSYRLYVDPELPDEVDVRRQCGKGWCVNPHHLAPGATRRPPGYHHARREKIKALALALG